MADKCEVNGIAIQFCSCDGDIGTFCTNAEANRIICKAIEKLAKGEGNSERPDAIITVDDVTIGIEHFKLYPETSRKGDKLEQYLGETTHFDKDKVGLQIGQSRHYDEKCTTISKDLKEHRLRYSDSQVLLSRLCTEFGKVYSEHTNNIPEYTKKLGAGRHKLVFLVECCNFKIKLDKCTDICPYQLNELRCIVMEADEKPDYIAFFNSMYTKPVLLIYDTSIPDIVVDGYSLNDVEIMLPGALPCLFQYKENNTNGGALPFEP